jgi:hypothetical protein
MIWHASSNDGGDVGATEEDILLPLRCCVHGSVSAEDVSSTVVVLDSDGGGSGRFGRKGK